MGFPILCIEDIRNPSTKAKHSAVCPLPSEMFFVMFKSRQKGTAPMLDLDRIYHADAFDLVPKIDDESVDLIVCDGPYGVTTNEWDRVSGIQEFNLKLLRTFSPKLKDGGALYLFGKPDCIDFIDYRPYLDLRSRIVWFQPSRLAQGRINYTNNYDVICYFIKGHRPRTFDLDAIRVQQLVELEHRLRCERVPSVVNGKFGKTKFKQERKEPGRRVGRHQTIDVPVEGTRQPGSSEYDSEARETHGTPDKGELDGR